MIYLIHFDRPLAHARHYIGYTESAATLPARIEAHRSGNGAKILKALNGHGIGYKVVMTWRGDRRQERKLKNKKKSSSLCPICQRGRSRKPAKPIGRATTCKGTQQERAGTYAGDI